MFSLKRDLCLFFEFFLSFCFPPFEGFWADATRPTLYRPGSATLRREHGLDLNIWCGENCNGTDEADWPHGSGENAN